MNPNQSTLEYLTRYGIKPSVQRIAIMGYLLHHRIHPTVEDIYLALNPAMPTLSKTTIYNTLRLFTEQGALLSLVIDEKNVRFDIDTSDHAHFQCIECGRVFDMRVERMASLHFPSIEGFTVSEIHLYYKGYCKECSENQKNG